MSEYRDAGSRPAPRVDTPERSRAERDPSEVETPPTITRIVSFQICRGQPTHLVHELAHRVGNANISYFTVKQGYVVLKELTTALDMDARLQELQTWATERGIIMTVLPAFPDVPVCSTCEGRKTVMKGQEGSHRDITCPDCGGSGQADTMVCPECKGRKTVMIETSSLLSHGVPVECNRCNGQGYVPRR